MIFHQPGEIQLVLTEIRLLHRSKLGPFNLGSLLVGQDIGVDILGVSKDNKISLGLAGLNFPVDDADAKKRSLSSANGKRGDGPVSKKKRLIQMEIFVDMLEACDASCNTYLPLTLTLTHRPCSAPRKSNKRISATCPQFL